MREPHISSGEEWRDDGEEAAAAGDARHGSAEGTVPDG